MLKDDTKTQLTKIAADLQKKTGKRIDYDTAISFLINEYLEKKKNWNKFDEFCEPIKDLAKDELLEELYKGREEDEKKYRGT
ncbi:MAG: hypothetical protein ACOC4M_10315 [Promethearchaeia archaeon]